jgi:hypothetical protein
VVYLPLRRLPAHLSRSAGGPQAAHKFSAESLEYIAGLDIERDAAVLKEQVGGRAIIVSRACRAYRNSEHSRPRCIYWWPVYISIYVRACACVCLCACVRVRVRVFVC